MMRAATHKWFFPVLLWAIVFGSAMPASRALGRDVPDYTGYVNDYAEMISAPAEQRLERMLVSFDKTDSTQVAVLTIDSLAGDSLEDFSIRVVDKWGVGRAGKDNGVLLLAVKKERKLRIEVGRGLEGVLTDLLAGRIVDLVITPRFKAGEFDQGFEDGAQAIIRATRGEFKAVAGARAGRQASSRLPAYLLVGFLVIHVLGRVSRVLGGVAGAVLLPVIGFAGLLLPFALLTLLFLMVIGAIAGSVLPRMIGRHVLFGGGFGGFGGFGGRGSGGFGGGSGGFGGGGFGGFGGGSFGGGGASGDW